MSDMLTGGQMLWKLEDCGDRALHLRHNVSTCTELFTHLAKTD